MPGKLKAKIIAGRHLPVMDRASDLTDAFVEVKFGNMTFKTDVCPKSLNPQWNSEWFKFEVDDEDLQDEPLQITVLDHDTYSANDAIGKVYIDIDPLLCSEAATVISGWFPIYDTIHGIRGEINVLVKVDLFNDLNRFRQSSCGVKFFCTTSVPRCYRAVMVHGFVEELVVNEDPEYQWIDRIRTPRASNEARQRLISLMSGELQRKIGLKVLEMGGNAVVGYLQCFDLEGESGLVVRAIGTACTLDKISNTLAPTGAANPSNSSPSKDIKEAVFGEEAPGISLCSGPPTPLRAQTFSSFSPSKSYSRQSSSSDTELSLTPKTGMGSGGSGGKEAGPLKALLRQQTQTALEQREFPFFTLTSFPPGFLLHVGGVVSARSVKLLDRIHNPDEPETRDAWWEEIRQEIKSHAKALGCHAVVGYSESTSICEEVCILSASGTAAILSSRFMQDGALDTEHRLSRQHGTERGEGEMGSSASLGFEDVVPPACGFCHIPYDELNMPFPAQLTYCHCCRRHKVPDVLFTTIDVPPEAHVTGKGCLIQARLCRTKKKAQGEGNATSISNLLPFLEYEMHTQLMNKLKLRSMNALFGLHIQISVGENMLLGLASATGVYLTALPSPGGIQIAGKTPSDITYEQHLSNMQKKINDTIAKNKELYEINPPEFVEELIGSPIPESRQRSRLFRSHSESSDEVIELDLSHGKKDAFVLEIDDTDAFENIHSLLTDAPTPPGFYSCNTEIMPGIYNWTSGLQMFTSVRVFRLSNANLTTQGLNKIFSDLCENLLKSFYFKLRSMVPCCLCHVNFTVAVPEDELIQVAVTAVAMSFDKDMAQENGRQSREKTLIKVTENEEQLQFPLELPAESSSSSSSSNPLSSAKGLAEVSTALPSARAPSVDYSSFTDRCSSWIEQLRLKAHTIRRGSIKTMSSLEKSSPLPEGRSRSLRSTRSYPGGSVTVVKMTPLSFIPGTKIIKYLGIINMFFIRETSSLREEGGVSGFLHSFIAEVFAMVRAHVAALGGNAVVSYSMKECVFMENPNKNQAQCLINVSGDAVIFIRESELEATPPQPQMSCGGEGT
ncbi:C2 domain-containing protein 5 isoform X1 [Ictalurus furcatus]|uniref:C2 domain-containing protein 5 isoform X1 n=1 Tax=Ictalurus furcatus TaxID=66913 RepID=UPI002351004E|nr:C2 domain-containing protein 5 isoform X1 [Ictalurus furcatus]XP_053478421.1 C2 domain-containing protein 5 isoform X1 [Ictalurus furcatus]